MTWRCKARVDWTLPALLLQVLPTRKSSRGPGPSLGRVECVGAGGIGGWLGGMGGGMVGWVGWVV